MWEIMKTNDGVVKFDIDQSRFYKTRRKLCSSPQKRTQDNIDNIYTPRKKECKDVP